MAKRFFNISAIAVIFFLQAASLIYACPGFYRLGENAPLTAMDKMPGSNSPCNNTEESGSLVPCYQLPYASVSSPAAGVLLSSSPGVEGLWNEDSDFFYGPLLRDLLVTGWSSPPAISLLSRCQVLRI